MGKMKLQLQSMMKTLTAMKNLMTQIQMKKINQKEGPEQLNLLLKGVEQKIKPKVAEVVEGDLKSSQVMKRIMNQ